MIKTLSNILVITLLSFSTLSFAQEEVKNTTDAPALTESSGGVSINSQTYVDAKTGMASVFSVTMPTDSVLTVSVDGNDTIKVAEDGTSLIKTSTVGNTAFFTVSKAGIFSVGAVTKCGLSFSIVINVKEKIDLNTEKVAPKVVVKAPDGCNA
jgi:hypothetical protein